MYKLGASNVQTFVFFILAGVLVGFVLPLVYDKDVVLNFFVAFFVSFFYLLVISNLWQKKLQPIVFASIAIITSFLVLVAADSVVYIAGFSNKFILKFTLVRLLSVDTIVFLGLKFLYSESVPPPQEKLSYKTFVENDKVYQPEPKPVNKVNLNEKFYQKDLLVKEFNNNDFEKTKLGNLTDLLINKNDAINLIETNALAQHVGTIDNKIKIISQNHFTKIESILNEIRQKVSNLESCAIITSRGDLIYSVGLSKIFSWPELAFGVGYVCNYFSALNQNIYNQIIIRTPDSFFTIEIFSNYYLVYQTFSLEGIISQNFEAEIRKEALTGQTTGINNISINNFRVLINNSLNTLAQEIIFIGSNNYSFYSFENNNTFSKNILEKQVNIGEKLVEVIG